METQKKSKARVAVNGLQRQGIEDQSRSPFYMDQVHSNNIGEVSTMHERVVKALLMMAIGVCACFTGCSKDDEGIVESTTVPSPTIVKGTRSYTFVIEGAALSIEVRDSIKWSPNLALYSMTVRRYVSGVGTIHITDAEGSSLWIDSLQSDTEDLNRQISAHMPLHVEVVLKSFTGAVAFSLMLGPSDINGTMAQIALCDSNGTSRKVFARGEPIYFGFSLKNVSDRDIPWSKPDSRDFFRFLVTENGTIIKDSFYGRMWFASPEHGHLGPGDSLRTVWVGSSMQLPLPPGDYVAWAEPQFVFDDLGSPGKKGAAFTVAQ